MNWFSKLEKKFGRYAIKNLMLYLIILYVIGAFIILSGNYIVYLTYLSMNPEMILKGEVWRLVTFLMMPPDASNLFFILLSLYIYWNLGSVIERVWGSFRFNIYIFLGIIGTILGSFIVYFIYGSSINGLLSTVGTTYINFSLFLAYAFTFPDATFLIFFIIPIKAKYLGIIEIILYVYMFITGDLATRIMIVASLINVLLFFVLTRKLHRFKPSEIRRKQEFKKKVSAIPRGNRHKCCVCGKTDEDGDDLSFRFCSKCEGNYEYCQEHLYTHTHITKADAEKIHTIR